MQIKRLLKCLALRYLLIGTYRLRQEVSEWSDEVNQYRRHNHEPYYLICIHDVELFVNLLRCCCIITAKLLCQQVLHNSFIKEFEKFWHTEKPQEFGGHSFFNDIREGKHRNEVDEEPRFQVNLCYALEVAGLLIELWLPFMEKV